MKSGTLLLGLCLVQAVSLARASGPSAHGKSKFYETLGNKVEAFWQTVHLPEEGAGTWQRELNRPEPALGGISPLDIHQKPKSSKSMSTVFHIYRQGKATRDIMFRAHTPLELELEDEPQAESRFQYDLEAMANSGFDVTKKTVILIPGYMSKREDKWCQDAKYRWLELYGEDINVIIVGWPDSNDSAYEKAVANSVLVARQVTIFLHYLAQLGGTSLRDQAFLDRIHLVGHSLGAHISGFVGQDLCGRVGRITGLDPAGPMFDSLPETQRLDRSDAQLVEVLHTNAGHMNYKNGFVSFFEITVPSLLGTGDCDARNDGPFYGINMMIGHIDYYANNGRDQEGCCTGGNKLELNICNHARATDIYIDLLRRHTGENSADQMWAYRARDFADFKSGATLKELCPQQLEARTVLSPAKVTDVETFHRCAAPLLDPTKATDELIRELRDVYQINFDAAAKSDEQSRFYFKTNVGL